MGGKVVRGGWGARRRGRCIKGMRGEKATVRKGRGGGRRGGGDESVGGGCSRVEPNEGYAGVVSLRASRAP